MRGKTILAVDDDALILKLLEAVVTTSKGAFVGASSAEQCLEALRTIEPSMLILDVNFADPGGMNGIALLERIRKDFPRLKSQVLFLTAQKDLALIERAEELGCNGFLLKPVDPRRLADRLRHHFSHPGGDEI